MEPKVTARNFDMTAKIRSYANDSIDGLNKYFNNIVSADMTLTEEKLGHTSELRLTVYRDVLVAKGEAEKLFAAIDQSVDKAKSQLLRYKGKLKDKDPDAVNQLETATTKPSTDDVDM